MIELASADQINGLSERAVLPAVTTLVGENEVKFPRVTDSLTPIILGQANIAVPRFSLFVAEDIFVNGFRLFEIGSMRATDTSLADDAARVSRDFNRKIATGQREDLSASYLQGARAPAKMIDSDGEVLLACSDEPSNFGSWLYRILPKILLSTESSSFEAIFVYQQKWMRDILDFAGLKSRLLHHDPTQRYHVRRGVIPNLPAPVAFLRSEARNALLSLHDRSKCDRTLGERIYVSRRGQSIRRIGFRVLENETELVERLAELNFREFRPEEYSFEEQLSVLDKAKIIIGCGGSNMFGCLFARRAELIVDIESCNEWSFAHRNVLSSTQAAFTMVKGRQLKRGTQPHLNWIIDAEALCDGLRELMKS